MVLRPQDSVDGCSPGATSGCTVCYLRDGDRVFETYWTTGRGIEVMGNDLRDARHDGLRPPGAVGGLARRLAAALGGDGGKFRTDGRPIAQWSRLAAARE